ncbi:Zf-CCCH domain protein [Ceratobasidium sp. AG-Ba]|nr:Zf-CCCH domain protein [Ceratobasidium sp. AG-Ba]
MSGLGRCEPNLRELDTEVMVREPPGTEARKTKHREDGARVRPEGLVLATARAARAANVLEAMKETTVNDYLDSATTTLMPLFKTEDVPALRPWLVKNLEPICDAEPDVLTNYVLALLKHDAPEPELRKTFQTQLYEFLDTETTQFVDRLFTVLKNKSFRTPEKTAKVSDTAATGVSSSSTAPAPAPTASSSSSSRDTGIPIPLDALLAPKSDSRGTKRRLDSDSGPGDQSRSPPKGPRLRESTVSRYDTQNSSGRPENGTRGYRDERDRDRAWDRERDGRNGVRNHPPPTGPAAERDKGDRNGKRAPCRDYHERGFCARGSSCIYSHGEEAVTPMGFPPMMGMMGPNFMMPWLMNQLGAGGYDPSQSRMNMSPPQPPTNGNMDVVMEGPAPAGPANPTDAKVMTPSLDAPSTNGANVARNQSMRGGHGAYGRNMRGRGTPAGSWSGEAEPFDGQGQGSSSEPRRDKTLVVEKIPPERLSLEEINNWFKKFGTVTNVAIDVPSAKALVSFSTHDEARDAWRSEDAVFGNRFVKLYWHRPMGNHGQAGAKLLAASAPIINNLSAPPKAEPVPIKAGPSQPPAINPSQQKFERLMAEQKVLMVKLTSAKADEKQSIKTRLRELITELQEVSATMRNESSTPTPPPRPTSTPAAHTNGTSANKNELDKDLEMMAPESETTKAEADGSSAVNPELQAKLKKLREEAASLGLNAEGAPTHPAPSYRPHGTRGRGAWRGRGRGGPPARGSMKLDNRPRTLVVKGLPDTSEAIDSAKSWFSSFPECEMVEANPSGELEVKYKTRFAAEQALASGATIPALGTVTFAWSNSTPTGATSFAAPAPNKTASVDTPAADADVSMKSQIDADEDDGWGASHWDDEDEGGGRRDRM